MFIYINIYIKTYKHIYRHIYKHINIYPRVCGYRFSEFIH